MERKKFVLTYYLEELVPDRPGENILFQQLPGPLHLLMVYSLVNMLLTC